MSSTKHNETAFSSRSSGEQNAENKTQPGFGSNFLEWWYSHFAPAEPLATASFSQREKIRRGKIASLATLVLMLFGLTLFIPAAIDQNLVQAIELLIELGISTLTLFLNRRGFVGIASILAFINVYIGGSCIVLSYPGGLTIDNLLLLSYAIVPDMLALAFFSANSLFIITCINAILTWVLLMYSPHDAAITQILQTSLFKVLFYAYSFEIITAVILYIWGRSTEVALARADRAEEIIALETYEKERQNQELEKKRRLDADIQQILQTHVAVANGDLSARAPLNQDNELWQVAGALNNLIARLQSQNNTERELRQQIREENLYVTGHFPVPKQK